MADVTFSGAAIVANKANAVVCVAGGTISKHDWVYRDTSDNNSVKAAQADDSSTATVYGMATHDAVDGELVIVAKDKATVTVGGGLTANTRYCLSQATAGGTAPQADLTSGDSISEVCFALSTTSLKIDINNTGQEVA